MARLPRSLTVRRGFQVHSTWRGHNREANLADARDKAYYLQALVKEMEKEEHLNPLVALTIMSNHAHEIFDIQNQKSFSGFLRRHHSRYGRYFNRRYNRSGQVAEGRPKTSLIEDDQYAMMAVFYVHANPVRANLVRDALSYPWSTHALYAFGHRQNWMTNIRFPKWYLALGHTNEERQQKYRKLFARYLASAGKLNKALPANSIFWGNPSWITQQRNCLRAWLRERTHTKSVTAREGPSLI
jgi:putative transposase